MGFLGGVVFGGEQRADALVAFAPVAEGCGEVGVVAGPAFQCGRDIVTRLAALLKEHADRARPRRVKGVDDSARQAEFLATCCPPLKVPMMASLTVRMCVT